MDLPPNLHPERPVIIAGPTASGKSSLALEIAKAQGGVIVNADALQVWSCWRSLSARPDADDETVAPHILYGHKEPGADYSVGHWLREAGGIMENWRNGIGLRPIFVGGTGLYLTALTQGLADIPPTPPAVRQLADDRMATHGPAALLADLDAETVARIDNRNPVRIQRAWEVMQTTGRGLAEWQDTTPPPILPLGEATALVIDSDRDWLARRIDLRFDLMLKSGALDEVRAALPIWDPRAIWAQAIGAPELMDHLNGRTTIEEATELSKAASRQYAKRQRTWFRARMRDWQKVTAT